MRDEMIWIEGGSFAFGSDRHYPEEAPVQRVDLDGFWIDAAPVTNAAFARFVDDTGYVTIAERRGTDGKPFGGGVFEMTAGPVDLDDPSQWWELHREANWRRPWGPKSTIEGLEQHPVVQITYDDAAAYAAWAGCALPMEAQWEFAARGGLDGAAYSWGESDTEIERLANVWRGEFPWRHETSPGTTRVGSYPANGYGLSDMAGNVWEWTADFYRPTHAAAMPGFTDGCPSCAPVRNPNGPASARTDPRGSGVALRVLKGGSFLCHRDYCHRYRPAARIPQAVDSCTCHTGFRCVAAGSPRGHVSSTKR